MTKKINMGKSFAEVTMEEEEAFKRMEQDMDEPTIATSSFKDKPAGERDAAHQAYCVELEEALRILRQDTYDKPKLSKVKSDGSTASYYELPGGATELQHLISFKNMNAQIGEIFRACYRYGEVDHSELLRDAKKIKFYAEAEIERLEKWENGQ